MVEEGRDPIAPAAHIHHDNEKYMIEVELPGAKKENIDVQMSETGFCVKAPKENQEYLGCWVLAHDVKPENTKARFEDEILVIKAPLAKVARGIKLFIE